VEPAVKILVLTDDHVGPVMAGSALRAWELARALQRAGHVVCLAAAKGSERPSEDGPAVVGRAPWRWASAVIGPAWSLPPRAFLNHRSLLIADGATPLLAELSVLPETTAVQRRRCTAAARLPLVLARADAVLAAGEQQCAWWQGRLFVKRLEVPVLSVPFGIPDQLPPAERDEIPGVPADWAVVLWWGGVWPWLDLETLLAARARLGKLPISIVVPTAPRPGASAVSFDRQDLQELSERYRLQPPQVVGLERWLPYNERHRILHRTTLLAVLHHPGKEAQLSFRTRALDGVWAGVPLLVTQGGEVSRLTQKLGWGGVVPPRDVGATAAALEALVGQREQIRMRSALRAARRDWRWSKVAQPLLEALPRLPAAPRQRLLGPAMQAAATLLRLRSARNA